MFSEENINMRDRKTILLLPWPCQIYAYLCWKANCVKEVPDFIFRTLWEKASKRRPGHVIATFLFKISILLLESLVILWTLNNIVLRKVGQNYSLSVTKSVQINSISFNRHVKPLQCIKHYGRYKVGKSIKQIRLKQRSMCILCWDSIVCTTYKKDSGNGTGHICYSSYSWSQGREFQFKASLWNLTSPCLKIK